MSPKKKGVIAAALLFALIACAAARRTGAVGAARWVLGGAAVAVGVFYARPRASAAGQGAPPLRVVSRTGLSGRTGLALVEADGTRLLVAYGDGFAQFHPAGPASGSAA